MCYDDHSVTVDDDVKEAINALKSGKHSGDKSCYSDHFINGTHRLFVVIAILLNGFITHNIAPESFYESILIPIPKDKKKSIHSSSNYRSIALSCIICKILDCIILKKHSKPLSTNDLQFGFKSKHSTTMCTFAIKEIIQYYKNKNSNIHIMLLDASQAFDRVNYEKLFSTLINRGLCPVAVRLLLNIYTHQKMCIQWYSHVTDKFTIVNGVKQGGVLSPTLFTNYIDDLLDQLKKSNVGCNVGNIYCGAFGYADDILLIAPTKTGLNKMISIAESFANTFDIIFNALKCKYMVFRKNDDCVSDYIVFDNIKILCSNFELHLGNPLSNDDGEKAIDREINLLYLRMNLLMSRFCFADNKVKYLLFKSYCMVVYGSQLLNYDCKHINKFYVAWRRCIRRLFNLPQTTHCSLLHILSDDNDIQTQLHKRVLKFVNKLCNSNNKVIQMCSKLAINGSNSDICQSINLICDNYGIRKDEIGSSKCFCKCKSSASDNDISKASIIQDFISFRSSIYTSHEDRESSTAIINMLCTE